MLKSCKSALSKNSLSASSVISCLLSNQSFSSSLNEWASLTKFELPEVLLSGQLTFPGA